MKIRGNKNFIYYKTSTGGFRRAREPFLKEAYVYNNWKMLSEGITTCYVYGKVKEGDLISTYYLHGIGFVTDKEEVAFAKSLQNKSSTGIGVIKIEFLSRENA